MTGPALLVTVPSPKSKVYPFTRLALFAEYEPVKRTLTNFVPLVLLAVSLLQDTTGLVTTFGAGSGLGLGFGFSGGASTFL